jgi:hypothetical protein
MDGAISGCGGCEWDIAEFLQQLEQNKKNQNQEKPKLRKTRCNKTRPKLQSDLRKY